MGLGNSIQTSHRRCFSGSDCFAESTSNGTRFALERGMNLNLETNEVQFILNVLGEMPAKSGVWPLIVKIKEQAEAQVPKDESTVQ